MPLFSEHITNMYYSGSPSYSALPSYSGSSYSASPYSSYSAPIGSSYSASYLNPGGNFTKHSSIVGYSRPPLNSRWTPNSSRNYSPLLSTISERGTSSPVRVSSPRRVPLSKRSYATPTYTPRQIININTADIDVSRNKYRPKPTSVVPDPESTVQNDNKSQDESPFMPRIDGKPETGIDSSPGHQRSTIKRGRSVVRLLTIKRKDRDSPRKSLTEKSAEQSADDGINKDETNEINIGWREKLSDDLVYKDKREKKTLGAKLVEKFLVKDKDDEEEQKDSLKRKQELQKLLVESSPSTSNTGLPDRRYSMELLAEQATVLDSLIRGENLSTATLDLSQVGVGKETDSLFKPQRKENPLQSAKSDHSIHDRLSLSRSSREKHFPKRRSLKKSASGGSICRLDSITEFPKEAGHNTPLPAIEENRQSIKNEPKRPKLKRMPKITSSVDISPPKSPLKFKVEDVTVEEIPHTPKKEINYSTEIEPVVYSSADTVESDPRSAKSRVSTRRKIKNPRQEIEGPSPEPESGDFWDKIGKRETVYLMKRKQNIQDNLEKSRRALFWFPEGEDSEHGIDIDNNAMKTESRELEVKDLSTLEVNNAGKETSPVKIVDNACYLDKSASKEKNEDKTIETQKVLPAVTHNAASTVLEDNVNSSIVSNTIDEKEVAIPKDKPITIPTKGANESNKINNDVVLQKTPISGEHSTDKPISDKQQKSTKNLGSTPEKEVSSESTTETTNTTTKKSKLSDNIEVTKKLEIKSLDTNKVNSSDNASILKDLPPSSTIPKTGSEVKLEVIKDADSAKKLDDIPCSDKKLSSSSPIIKTDGKLKSDLLKKTENPVLSQNVNKLSPSSLITETDCKPKTDVINEDSSKKPDNTDISGSDMKLPPSSSIPNTDSQLKSDVIKNVDSSKKSENTGISNTEMAVKHSVLPKNTEKNVLTKIQEHSDLKPKESGITKKAVAKKVIPETKKKSSPRSDKIVEQAKVKPDKVVPCSPKNLSPKGTIGKETQESKISQLTPQNTKQSSLTSVDVVPNKDIGISDVASTAPVEVPMKDVDETPEIMAIKIDENIPETNIDTTKNDLPPDVKTPSDAKKSNPEDDDSRKRKYGLKVSVALNKPAKQEAALRPLIATPRPLQKKTPQIIHSSSDSDTSTEEETSSEEEETESSDGSGEFFECENHPDGRTSTGSNDSGFDSSAPTSPAGFVHVKKGGEGIPGTSAAQPGHATDVHEQEIESSTAYSLFRKTGRFTPPAKSIPRFRKYVIDDFHFIKVLGKGSFGKVLLAELRDTEYYYAVKCLKKDVVLEDDDVECTLIERKVLALGTNHPFLCHLFATFQTDSHLFFVMEYLNGGDLMFHIQQSGRFTEAQSRFYAAEIVSGLKFLHKRGIVYRDLKLDNILLDFEGHVRIADFGMCKLQIFLEKTADTFCGTPDYMAPEIIKGLKYNQTVDWWSFGVLLYEMLIGQSPFSGCDEDELFWSICNEVPSYPRFLSPEALSILTRLLDKDARTRLGGIECIHGDIRDQDFFRPVNWDRLERKELETPFKPRVRHPLDTQYFDRAFTGERPRLTAVEPQVLRSMDQTPFRGFSYTNPNVTDR